MTENPSAHELHVRKKHNNSFQRVGGTKPPRNIVWGGGEEKERGKCSEAAKHAGKDGDLSRGRGETKVEGLIKKSSVPGHVRRGKNC